MELMVIAYALLAFALILLILGPKGKKEDRKNQRIGYFKRDKSRFNIGSFDGSFFDRVIGPSFKKILKFIDSKTPQKKEGSESKNEQTEKMLRLAGMFIDVQTYNFRKTVFTIALVTVTLVLLLILKLDTMISLLILLVAAVLAIVGPSFFLKQMAKNHQLGIKRQLPDAMDLLSVCIEAGLSFDAALMKVSEKMSGPFIDELLIVYREIQMGRTRRDALQTLADSTTVDELKTFVSALIQAEQLGIPINNIMQTQAEQLRETRKLEAKEKGMKSSIKMLIPMLIFIFPVVFIIILGPTIMNIIEGL